MGQAKRKQLAAAAVPMVYHHTSTLRTNLLWMSGVIDVEGSGRSAIHPDLGEVKTDANLRRAMSDFPRLAWFTKRLDTPGCLLKSTIFYVDDQGRQRSVEMTRDMVNVYALNRIAIGFPIADIGVIPWTEHPGFLTEEGVELNESASAAGDNPADWYVSEQPVDILKSTQIWCSKSMMKPKLERFDWYLKDVHNMVRLCREQPAYIPPTWIKPEDAQRLSKELGLSMMSGGVT